MILTRKNIIVFFVLAFLSLTPIACAQIALNFDSLGGGVDYHQGSYSLGWRFTANHDISVNALGFYDDLQNGFKESHDVGIYDFSTCQLLASTTVLSTDPLSGFFRFRFIKPVVLPGGHDYYIAGVTGADSYAISVGTINIDPAITYWGYAIYGITQATNTLQCPNGSSSQGFHGDYGPSFNIGTDDGTSLNSGGGGKGGTKRNTATTLFCNRNGPTLTNADCSVSVADTDAPPRSTPTGTVNFVTTGGLFPSTSSCVLTQTPFSPGIASCTAQFALPIDFPVGVKFPITATYTGDTAFASSSAGHNLIQAGCVGDQDHPCSGAVALTFANLPQILKNAIATVFQCGPTSLPKDLAVSNRFGNIVKCIGKVIADLKIGEILSQLDQKQFQDLSAALSKTDANNDKLIKIIKDLGAIGNDAKLLEVLNNTQKINDLIKNSLNEPASPAPTRAFSFATRSKKDGLLLFGTSDISVNNNKTKTITVHLTKRATKILKGLKAAGVTDLNLNMSIKGKRSSGPKKPFSTTMAVDFGIVN